jgi:hypothetical protein
MHIAAPLKFIELTKQLLDRIVNEGTASSAKDIAQILAVMSLCDTVSTTFLSTFSVNDLFLSISLFPFYFFSLLDKHVYIY